jgi:HEAT repeat protein
MKQRDFGLSSALACMLSAFSVAAAESPALECASASQSRGQTIQDLVGLVQPEGDIVKSGALEVLVTSRLQAMPELSELMLHAPSAALRENAAYAISVIAYRNPEATETRGAIQALTTAAQSQDSQVRRFAITALGSIGNPASNAIPIAARLCKDESVGVRMDAVRALHFIGPATSESISALKQAMDDPNGDVRVLSAEAWLAIGQPASNAIPVLNRAAEDESVGVRTLAVDILGKISGDSPEKTTALQRFRSDRDGRVRSMASKALGFEEAHK